MPKFEDFAESKVPKNQNKQPVNKENQSRPEKETAYEIKSSMPEDALKRFNPGEILKHGRESFTKHLKEVNLRTLIGYIEAGGVNLEDIGKIPQDWKERIEDIKQQKNSFVMINPGLSFLSEQAAAELALQELLSRIANETN
jgi:hypothetical protein